MIPLKLSLFNALTVGRRLQLSDEVSFKLHAVPMALGLCNTVSSSTFWHSFCRAYLEWKWIKGWITESRWLELECFICICPLSWRFCQALFHLWPLIVTEVSIHNCINSGWLSEQSWSKAQIYSFIHIVMSFYNFVSVLLGTFTFFFVKKPRYNEQLIRCYLWEKRRNRILCIFWILEQNKSLGL